MALGSEYSSFASNIMAEIRKSDKLRQKKKSGISFIDLTQEHNGNENKYKMNGIRSFIDLTQDHNGYGNGDEYDKGDWNNIVISSGDEGDSTEEHEDGVKLIEGSDMSSIDSKKSKSEVNFVNVVKSSENVCESKKHVNENEELVEDLSGMKEVLSLKRKRDDLLGMLEWMVKVAKNPIDPGIGAIPESYKMGGYGNDNCWKRALLVREALFLKRNSDQSNYQKKQKMHPSMFDDNLGISERPRSTPRQRLGSRLDMQPIASIYTNRPYKRIPISTDFQADVPEWTGVVSESDPKWLGTQLWPLKNKKPHDLLIETLPIGKGRLDPCGCSHPGTINCVKFHVSKRRMKLKYELGSTFYAWKFDNMGEECSISWSFEEENTFKLVVKENPFSHQKCFWKEMCEALPKKNWVDKVNYYYNVFVLQRRAFQNRFTPLDIDSDDDECEYGMVKNNLSRKYMEAKFC